MKAFFDHIERIKGKPHHVRKQIAFGAAGAGAAFVALVWLAGNISSGSFAIKGPSFADLANPGAIETGGGDSLKNFAGAAAAFGDAENPARIEIVDTSSSTRAAKKPEPTTIPF